MTAHKRIRPFNTKETYPEQKLDNDLCQGVVARGTMVFLRGQVAQDLDTRESLHVGDAAQQTARTMANIKMLMEEAGGIWITSAALWCTSPTSGTARMSIARWASG